jgi:hypothetical protein
MARFECLDINAIEWGERLKAFADYTIYQSPTWFSFVTDTQKSEPILAALREGTEILGYFTGAIVVKSGMRILGSPFAGWNTPYMGLNILPGIPRRVAVEALSRFAFEELGCLHFEMSDRHLTLEDITGLGFEHSIFTTAVVDLTPPEDGIFARMTSDCRGSIRKGEKRGIMVEEASDEGFAEEHYQQLQHVFLRQHLVLSFGVDRVRQLVRHLYPAGMVLLVRARDSTGRCVASGIFLGSGRGMHLWSGASWGEFQALRPNEAIHWYAMRYWKKRGAQFYDPGGKAYFKSKFGGREASIMTIRKSKYSALSCMRDLAKQLVRTRQKVLGTWEHVLAGSFGIWRVVTKSPAEERKREGLGSGNGL